MNFNTTALTTLAIRMDLTPKQAIALPATIAKVAEIGKMSEAAAINMAMYKDELRNYLKSVICQVAI
jgi:hypothetical protein